MDLLCVHIKPVYRAEAQMSRSTLKNLAGLPMMRREMLCNHRDRLWLGWLFISDWLRGELETFEEFESAV